MDLTSNVIASSICSGLVLIMFILTHSRWRRPKSCLISLLRATLLLIAIFLCALEIITNLRKVSHPFVCDVVSRLKMVLFTFFKYVLYLFLFVKARIVQKAMDLPNQTLLRVAFGLTQLLLIFPIVIVFFYAGIVDSKTNLCVSNFDAKTVGIAFLLASGLDIVLSTLLLYLFAGPIRSHLGQMRGRGNGRLNGVVKTNVFFAVVAMLASFGSYLSNFIILYYMKRSNESLKQAYCHLVLTICVDMTVACFSVCILTSGRLMEVRLVRLFFSLPCFDVLEPPLSTIRHVQYQSVDAEEDHA